MVRLLGETGIPEPEKRFKAYPFELSGGMQQRAMIALAISCRPRLLISDEPTTALDVTVKIGIMDLLRHVQRLYDIAILLITHDLGVVAEMARRVMVMYTGKIVESAPTSQTFVPQPSDEARRRSLSCLLGGPPLQTARSSPSAPMP